MSAESLSLIAQFAGSLAAILLLVWLARWLGLGPEKQLLTDAEVAEAARDAHDGFEPATIALGSDGRGALARGEDGRIMLLRPHGSHVASRILGPASSAKTSPENDGEGLVVDCGERTFGAVTLQLRDAQAWADAINAL
ncbi:hypothetical protein PF049_01440 [Erythrobacteraceae bacterium WH01K]|nr:hypothetical protein PF049_01440 [Erythrobacteraceae bacterium WH01K]